MKASLATLSPEQRKVIETWDQGLAVLAGAGSGKTTTLVIKCEELLKRNTDARFVAVSFTEKSAADLKDKLSARLPLRGEGGPLSGHWVMTIHGLCGAIIREFPREAGIDGEETLMNESQSSWLWEQALESLWNQDLSEELSEALDLILARESREETLKLLARTRSLDSFGGVAKLLESKDLEERALGLLAQAALEKYERLKSRQGVLDFNDLEKKADLALSHPEVRDYYRKRFDLVMVDEFQDTNPVQAQILWRFAREDRSNLCVVGDPKQSIYRFRDADITVFEECCSQLPVRLTLSWNFRSRPGIIEFANEVCLPCFEASEMTYEALVPKRESHPELKPVLKVEVETPEQLADWICSERARGVPLESFALLLRKIRGSSAWLKALTAAGIPLAVGSGGLFWEDPRVREMTAFLKAWNHPGHRYSMAVFLRAPWVGVDDLSLDQWIRSKRDLWECFFESNHPLAGVLRPYRDRPTRPGELLQALLYTEEQERELGASLLGLWHRAEELSYQGLSFHDVVTEFTRSAEEARRERDVPPPRNQGQLLVLTVHGSKGLEFPRVILIDFPEKPERAKPAPLLFWDRHEGTRLSKRTEDGERDKKDSEEIRWKERERQKEIAESKRVFYVALTRAQEQLILVYPRKTTPHSELVFDPEVSYAKDQWRAWIELADRDKVESFSQKQREVGNPTLGLSDDPRSGSLLQGASSQSVRWKRPRHSVTEWNVLGRCARAYEWSFIRPKAIASGNAEMKFFTGEKIEMLTETEMSQRDLGTRVHACLENGDFDGLRALETEVGKERFSAEPVVSWAMSSPWMAPAQPQREVWNELAFEMPVGSETLVGSMDRVVCTTQEDGTPRYTVIDFKVTAQPKSVEALLDSYQAQLQIYLESLLRLDPAAAGFCEAVLVNISSRTIQTVPVPHVTDGKFLEQMASQASRIVGGEEGEPKPGLLCRVCEFREKCTEGARFLSQRR